MVEKSARLELRVSPGLLERVDAARGDVSRTRWVERALEAALAAEPEPMPPLVAAAVREAFESPVLERQQFAERPLSRRSAPDLLAQRQAALNKRK